MKTYLEIIFKLKRSRKHKSFKAKRMARAWHRIKRARMYEKEDFKMLWDRQTYERVKVRPPKVTGEVGDKNYGINGHKNLVKAS